MADIHSLKKQLRGICSTQKLTKAMRTTSTVKFSKLNARYAAYAAYSVECNRMLQWYGAALAAQLGAGNPEAPPAVLVIAGNKGMCGSFNSELLRFAEAQLASFSQYRLFACGRKAFPFFKSRHIPIYRETVLSDVPSYDESAQLLDELIALRRAGEISDIYVIFPRYAGMVMQRPTMEKLFVTASAEEESQPLLIPDRQTLVGSVAQTVYRAVFYRLFLESALGAQAATVMTMRTAYDTATEYRLRLEGQINRMRQSAVTADVLETATEWG